MTGQDPVLPGDQQTIARWFNTDAYALNALGTFGNAGRNTFFGPGITNVDASIIRNFRMGSKTLQFRLEAFNVLNNPIWNDPNTTMTSAAVRHDQQHEKADARGAARCEVRVLIAAVANRVAPKRTGGH